jgi:hypothetical protein
MDPVFSLLVRGGDPDILAKNMRTQGASVSTEISDADFAAQLRTTTERYLDAIQAWENKYQKYYRLPSPGPVSSDLEAEHQEYLAARGELKKCVDRGRRLCMRHSIRDPWPGMLHIRLGASAPQTGFAPAIGRAERALISKCLDDLDDACNPGARPDLERAADGQSREMRSGEIAGVRRGFFRRIADYFL